MHYFRRSTLDRLQNHIILLWFIELHDSEHATSHLIFEWFLTELAFESFPEIGGDLGAFIYESLTIQPLFKTFNMDLAHATTAFTRAYQLIARLVL